MEKPYVISAELELRNPRVTPLIKTEQLDMVRSSLDADLRAMGKNTLWVEANTIRSGIDRATKQSKLPLLSLDDRYASSADGRLGISRGVDARLDDNGYVARTRYRALEKQFATASTLGTEVQLVDDVIFSGDMLLWVAEQLKQRGVRIGRVVCGIAIKEGAERLEQAGIPVDATVCFDEVEDELCERDFFVIPGSGRRRTDTGQSVLYFDTTNGKPEKWASLSKEAAPSFCVASLERSRQLIREGTDMRQIGSFVGIDTAGDAIATIENRMMEELK